MWKKAREAEQKSVVSLSLGKSEAENLISGKIKYLKDMKSLTRLKSKLYWKYFNFNVRYQVLYFTKA